MPLDHYVSQVHLRRFYSPALGNRMYAIRKSDLKTFTPRSEDVCRIMDGSSNLYLRETRYIEDFLKTIEPNYNAALDKLISGLIDRSCIYAIAGFVAYVVSCSPAGMRIGCDPLKNIVESTTAMMDAEGSFPPPPPQLGNTTLTELIRDGVISITVDPKFPQALGINTILFRTATLGNCNWETLYNDFGDSPFCTSDFPIAIEETGDPRILNRIVPLAPNLAIRIKPGLTIRDTRPDFSFANFGCHRRKVGFKELVRLNCLIVRCAEDLVFHRDDSPWVRSLVAKNRHYRIEPYTQRLPASTGEFLVSTQRVVPMTRPPEARISHTD